jgi:hypothetical protein
MNRINYINNEKPKPEESLPKKEMPQKESLPQTLSAEKMFEIAEQGLEKNDAFVVILDRISSEAKGGGSQVVINLRSLYSDQFNWVMKNKKRIIKHLEAYEYRVEWSWFSPTYLCISWEISNKSHKPNLLRVLE